MAKKKTSKVNSSPSTGFNKSKIASVPPLEDEYGDATMSSFQSPSTSRAPSPAMTEISTSGSEDNQDIKEYYVDGDAEEFNQPPSVCKWVDCSEEFIDLQALIDHLHEDHIGSNKNKYWCDWEDCPRGGKLQNSRFALLSHVRSHTGEKPFTCPRPECDKSFSRSDAMAKHMRVQHGTAPPPARPSQIKKPTAGAAAGAGGEGSDGEEAGTSGALGGETTAITLSSIWECDADLKTEHSLGSSGTRTSRAAGHSTKISQRERSSSTDLPNSGGNNDSAPISYPAGHGWVYEEIPDPPLTGSQLKIANEEAADEADFSFWSTKGSEIELLRNQILSNQGATGAGGLPIDASAQFEGISVEEKGKMDKMKRNTLNGTEGGIEEAIKLGFIPALPHANTSNSDQNFNDLSQIDYPDSDSEIDEESKESWMREDRQNAFEIGLLSDVRKRWAESERSLRPKRREVMESHQALDDGSMKVDSSIVAETSSANSSTPAPSASTSAMSPPPPPDSSSSRQVSKRRKVGNSEAVSLGLFTNVPVNQSSTKTQIDKNQSKVVEEDDLSLMKKRYIIEKAKLKLISSERRRMESELKELKKLRRELRDGLGGTKEGLNRCLTMELGPNVQAIFSPPSSP